MPATGGGGKGGGSLGTVTGVCVGREELDASGSLSGDCGSSISMSVAKGCATAVVSDTMPADAVKEGPWEGWLVSEVDAVPDGVTGRDIVHKVQSLLRSGSGEV